MQKTFIALGAALLIATSAFSTAAMAGGCGKGFGGHRGFSHHSYNQSFHAKRKRQLAKQRAIAKQRQLARIKAEKRRQALAAAKARKAKLAAAAAQERRAKLASAALAESKAEVAKTESNTVASTSIAALAGLERALPTVPVTQVSEEAAASGEAQVATVEPVAADVGCKRYIASAGLTVNVPCAN